MTGHRSRGNHLRSNSASVVRALLIVDIDVFRKGRAAKQKMLPPRPIADARLSAKRTGTALPGRTRFDLAHIRLVGASEVICLSAWATWCKSARRLHWSASLEADDRELYSSRVMAMRGPLSGPAAQSVKRLVRLDGLMTPTTQYEVVQSRTFFMGGHATQHNPGRIQHMVSATYSRWVDSSMTSELVDHATTHFHLKRIAL